MWKNYLKIAFRSLRKRRLFSFVNVVGLVLGLVTFLALFAFVATEWTYNDFHINKDRLYRVVVVEGNGEGEIYLPPGYATILQDQFADLESVDRLAGFIGGGLVAIPGTDLAFKENEVSYVEGRFFEDFSFPILRGTADLKTSQTAVITEEMASKFFGEEDALGKSFTLSNQFGKLDFTVTGVLEGIPDRSDIGSNIFLSIHTLENPDNRSGNGWADPNGLESGFVNLFALTKNGVDAENLSKQITEFIRKNPGSEDLSIILQPLPEIHLGASISDPLPSNGSLSTILVFAAMAFLILGIAYVNYLNLSSASILTRIKEIKMRKVLGAKSWQLAEQFMVETILLMGVSTGIGLLFLYLVQNLATTIFGKGIWFGAFQTPVFWLLILGLIGICALISGLYVVALSGKFDHKSQIKFKAPESEILKKGLVVFQFVISIGIIVCTLVIRDQLNFMQNQDLGMNLDQKIIVEGPNDVGENKKNKMANFKQSLLSQSFVKGLGASNALPGVSYNFSAGGITPMVPRPEDKDKNYAMMIMDDQFIPTYKIELLAGRNFTKTDAEQGWGAAKKLILNESSVRELGLESPADAIGKNILWGDPYEVVGVVKDYHHLSLREKISPMIFLPSQADGYFSLVVNPDQMASNLASIQDIYEDIFPGNPFTYFFMDEKFASQYQSEQQLSKAFTIAGILAILISCLGLFGLAAYTVQQRSKEIGIRKVLGASSASLLSLVSKDFIIIVGIAMLFAFPLAWYAMQSWQEEFPYQAGLSILSFLAAGGLTLLIAVLTVGSQALKAAWSNPVDSIKDE
ncbi:putative ABC transport system permease protein [Algoriphagus iocasae]|uniref:Putative ABC transport system permease protein n=1 Tax=Algoriphagus iocasae TaxID=1836499 RepID=A0A841MPK5_9BACT|nr:ABC transporter permease [Algoriphagus iocasae]MBB6327509.1 putative ABC transport system permease protein [Algoriphagus iocasae]